MRFLLADAGTQAFQAFPVVRGDKWASNCRGLELLCDHFFSGNNSFFASAAARGVVFHRKKRREEKSSEK